MRRGSGITAGGCLLFACLGLSGCLFDGGNRTLTGTWIYEYYFSLSYSWRYTDSATFRENGRMAFERVDGLGTAISYRGGWTLGKDGLAIAKDSCLGRSEAGSLEPIDCGRFDNAGITLGYDGNSLYKLDPESGGRIPFDKR